MQCQEPPAPFFGLWSRLRDFDPAELVRLLEGGDVVRTTMMRATLHLVSTRDFRAWRPLFQPMLETRFNGTDFARQTRESTWRRWSRRAARSWRPSRWARPRWAARSRSGSRLRPELARLRGAVHAAGGPAPAARDVAAQAGRPRDRGAGRDAATPDVEDIVLRYLAAFGPSTVSDVRLWSGLPGIADVVRRLGLVTYEDERGRELYDVPDGLFADPDTHAPPRFLGEFDNILLAHDDRSRVLPWGHRLGVVGGYRFVLVDGHARATWKLDERRRA